MASRSCANFSGGTSLNAATRAIHHFVNALSSMRRSVRRRGGRGKSGEVAEWRGGGVAGSLYHALVVTQAPVLLSDRDYVAIDGYAFQRWGERSGSPYRDIRPLAESAARRVWERAIRINGDEPDS